MRMVPVESSNIESIGWENNNLYVKYLTGKTYLYEGVSEDLFYELLGSRSKGHIMNETIKPNYKFRCLD